MNLVIPFASADAVLLRGRMSVLLALIEWMRDELSVFVVHLIHSPGRTTQVFVRSNLGI
jgi:hypothetical protein